MDDYFTFKMDDETYVMPLKTASILTPGWVRTHRQLTDTDYIMSLIEELCALGSETASDEEKALGQKIIVMLDNATWPDHQRIQNELIDHIRATVGE